MNHFVFSIEETKYSRTYGGATVTAAVYRVKRNMPVFLLRAEWCTRAFKGEPSSVMNALACAGHLPKRFRDGYYTGHHLGPVAGQPFTISKV